MKQRSCIFIRNKHPVNSPYLPVPGNAKVCTKKCMGKMHHDTGIRSEVVQIMVPSHYDKMFTSLHTREK